MPNRNEHLARLIAGYLRQELTVEEQAALATWLAERPENREFLEKLDDAQHLQQKLQVFHDADRDRLWALTQANLTERGFEQHHLPICPICSWRPYSASLLLGVVA